MVVRYYSSVAPETTLSSGITNANTVITVGSVTGFPSSTPYTLALDYEGITEELVQVNNAAGTTLTVARAVDGTSAASHNAGARVRHVSSARDFSDSRTHENSDQGIHGLAPGDVLVGEDAVQTLTNKTLASPTINGVVGGSPAFSGTWTGQALATAKVRLSNTSDASLASTDHAFQIGLDNSQNLRLDNNEIMSVNNGAAGTLVVQNEGGSTTFMSGAVADNVTNAINANGTVQGNIMRSDRPTGTATTFIARTTGDVNGRWFVQANGANRWSNGTATSDAGISRTSAATLTVDNNLVVPGTATVGTAQVIDLNVTGSATLPQTTASGTSVATAASGWAIGSIAGYMIGGSTYVTFVMTRTGATIPTNAVGNITDSTMCTVLPAWRPNAGYLVAVGATISDGNGHGAARLNTDGTLDFLTWMPGIDITSGSTSYRVSLSYPSA